MTIQQSAISLYIPSTTVLPSTSLSLFTHVNANIIWLSGKYIHHALLPFLKVNSLTNMKTHRGLRVFMCSGAREVKSTSKSSLKVHATFCLFSESSSILSKRTCADGWRGHVSEWTNTAWQNTSQCGHMMSYPPPSPLLSPLHFLPSHAVKESQSCLYPLSGATRCYLIGQVKSSCYTLFL